MEPMQLSTEGSLYRGDFPSYNRPLTMGFFSVDETGRYEATTAGLGYLVWGRFGCGNVHLDLSRGERDAVGRSDESENSFYRYLCDHPAMVHNYAAAELAQAGFICNRGVLRKIANMPYQERENDAFSAFLYQGNIYVCHIKLEREPLNQYQERCSHWGYKFEQYMLASHPNKAPITNVPVKEGEEFGCVFESKLNTHRIFFAAEMDGIFIDKNDSRHPVANTSSATEESIVQDLRKRKFVELKTSSFSEKNNSFRKFKSKDIWLQNFFSGVEIIVLGIRNYNGIVSSLKKFQTWDMLRVGEDSWNPEICMNFCDKFLSFVKECFAEEINRLPNWSDGTDIRTLPPIELFFKRKVHSNVTLSEKLENAYRPFVNKWFTDGVDRN